MCGRRTASIPEWKDLYRHGEGVCSAKKIGRVVICLAGLLLLSTCAMADQVTFKLNVPDAALASFPGPFGYVLVNRIDSTHATVTFSGTEIKDFQYLFGGVDAANINVNGTFKATFSGNAFSGFTGGKLSAGNNGGVVDIFGTFTLHVNDSGGFTSSYQSIIITLTATRSTSWASAESVLISNPDFVAAAHVYVCNLPCLPTQKNVPEGYVGAEPNAMLLLGVGLSAFAFMKTRHGWLH